MNRQTRKRNRIQADRVLGIVFLAIILIFIVLNLLTKDKAVSAEENRTLAQRPELSFENVAGGTFMERFEDYTADQFAGRNLWRSIRMGVARFGGRREVNDVFLGKKKHLLEDIVRPVKEEEDVRVARINEFVLSHGNLKTAFLLVPDAAATWKAYLPRHAVTADQKELADALRAALPEQVLWIDAFSALANHADERLYYQTDHHWTTLGARYAFEEAASVLELPGAAEAEYDIYPVSDSFNGVLASTSGFLGDTRETIEIYVPRNDTEYVLTNIEAKQKLTTLYDRSMLDTKDQYAVFMGGNFSLLDLRTTSESGRRLLLVKDSFANCFIPFLTPYYEEIVIVDPRYYAGTADDILATYRVTDVLFLYSGNTFFADRNLEGFLEPGANVSTAETEGAAGTEETMEETDSGEDAGSEDTED